jgi:hypothetical protein
MGSANSTVVGRNSGASGKDLSHGGTSSLYTDGTAAAGAVPSVAPSVSWLGGANRPFGQSR